MDVIVCIIMLHVVLPWSCERKMDSTELVLRELILYHNVNYVNPWCNFTHVEACLFTSKRCNVGTIFVGESCRSQSRIITIITIATIIVIKLAFIVLSRSNIRYPVLYSVVLVGFNVTTKFNASYAKIRFN